MIITVSSKQLSETLNILAKNVEPKNALPILGNFIFIVKDSELSIKAGNVDTIMTAKVSMESVEGEGSFAVAVKDLLDAVKNIPEQPMTIETDDDSNLMKVRHQSGFFSLPTSSAVEFPVMIAVSETSSTTITIAEGLLQENIARTVFATAQDELRPVMNGVYFDLTKEHLAIVASDGHQLVRNCLTTIKAEEGKEASLILPKKVSLLLKNFLRTTMESNVTLAFDERRVDITTEGFTIESRLIEGRYPNYNSVIPQNNPNIVVVDRASFVAALKRVSPFSNNSSNLARLHVEQNLLQVDTEDYDFSKTASERLAADYSGTPMNIGFNCVRLTEVLANIKAQEISIHLADPSRAALVKPTEQPDGQEITMLIMPMLIND